MAAKEKLDEEEEDRAEGPLIRTRRPFGGLIREAKRRSVTQHITVFTEVTSRSIRERESWGFNN